MANQTPAERVARAQTKVSSENSLGALGAYNTSRVLQDREERLAEQEKEKRIAQTNPIVRALASLGDLTWDVAAGTGRWLEGIIDFAASTHGWMFGKNVREKTKDFVAKDLTAMWYDDVQEWHDTSYFKQGGMMEQVGQGVGQLLPMIIIGAVTGGGASAASGAGQAISTAALAASAAGNATGEAFAEGAGYGQGLAYGAATGAVEAATEKIFGGATSNIFGKGIADKAVSKFAGNVAKTGAARVAKNMAEEAVEEGVAELVNPALKSIYKGRDAFSEYGDKDYWKQVGQAAAVGGLTAGVFGETIGRATAVASGGKAGDINAAMDEINTINTKARNLQARGELNPNDTSLDNALRANYQIIENTLKKSTDKQRARYIERFRLDNDFNTDGSMKPSLKGKLGIEAVNDDGSPVASTAVASGQKRYVSYGAWNKNDTIQEDLNLIRESLSKKMGEDVGAIEINTDPLSEQAEKNYQQFTKAINAYGNKSGVDLDFVVVKPNKAMNAGVIKESNTLYISADSFESGQWATDTVHEIAHLEEGTKGYGELLSFLAEKTSAVEKGEETTLAKGYIDAKPYNEINRKLEAGEELTAEEKRQYETFKTESSAHATEIVLGNEEFIQRFIDSDEKGVRGFFKRIHNLIKAFKGAKTPEAKAQLKILQKAEQLYLKAAEQSGNVRLYHQLQAIFEDREEMDDETLDNKNANRDNEGVQFSVRLVEVARYLKRSKIGADNVRALKLQLYELYNGVPDTVADGIALEVGAKIFYVDSSKEGDDIPFGVRWMSTVNNYDERKKRINQINKESAEKNYGHRSIFEKLGVQLDNGNSTNGRRSQSDDNKANQAKPQNNETRTASKTRDTKSRLSKAQFSLAPAQLRSEQNVSIQQIEAKYEWDFKSLSVDEQDNEIIIKKMSVYKEDYGSGLEQHFLDDLINYAERNGKVIAVEIPKKHEYVELFRKNGFVENKDNAISDANVIMSRFPKSGIRNTTDKIATDSKGNELTSDQKEFYKESKARNEKGELLVLYHGTPNDFNEFDPNRFGETGAVLGRGIYLTPDYGTSLQYTEGVRDSMELYANITKPLVLEDKGVIGTLEDNGVDIEPYMKKQNVSDRILLDTTAILKELGYDSIMDSESGIVVAFEPNQVKNVTNKAPTRSKDIRFSLKPTPEQAKLASTPKRQVQFNLAYTEQHKADLKKKFSTESMTDYDALMKEYQKIIDIWNKLGGELNSDFLKQWNERNGKNEAFEVFKAQVGYKYNLELSTMCKKGVPLFEAINEIVKKEALAELGTDRIDADSKKLLYAILSKKGYEIPCAICYVEQARQRESTIIKNFLEGIGDKGKNGYRMGWNAILHEAEDLMKSYGVDYAFPAVDRSIATTNYTKQQVSMTAKEQDAFYKALITIANNEVRRVNEVEGKALEEMKSTSPAEVQRFFKGKGKSTGNFKVLKDLFFFPDSRMTIEADLLLSSLTTTNLKKFYGGKGDLYGLFNAQGGSGGYKLKQTPIAYWGQILSKGGKSWNPSAIRNAGGVRNQSNSDFQMYTLIDQMQIYADLTARGFYLHAYTKVLDELKIFGLSNAKINASLIPAVKLYFKTENGKTVVDVEKTQKYAGLDENGNPIYDDVEGIPHEEAFMLLSDPEYSKSLTGICIGYSDEHILKLLDEKRVQLIIGFHDKTDDGSKRFKGAEYAHNYNGENEAYDPNAKDGAGGNVSLPFSEFLSKAEKLFGYDTKTETFKGNKEVEFNGKTYVVNDIPRLAADMYLKHCADNGISPAYSRGGIDFSKHPNYYKLLGDFGLYDSQGNYVPHRKVNFKAPESVPYLDENGKKSYRSTESLVKQSLEAELSIRDRLAYDLADESDDGIVNMFADAFGKLKSGMSVNEIVADMNRDASKPVQSKPTKKITFQASLTYKDGKLIEAKSELERAKTFSKAETQSVVNTILGEYLSFGEAYGTLRGKTQKEVVNMMWQGFNKNGNKDKVARDIASYIVEESMMVDTLQDEVNSVYRDTVSVLKDYLHSINLDSIKAEIRAKYGNDNSVFARWGKRKDTKGIAPDVLAQELEARGIDIGTDNSADIFFRIDELYTKAVKVLKDAKKKVIDSISDEEIKQEKENITKAILDAYQEGGHVSKVMGLITEHREAMKTLSRRLTVKNRLVYSAQQMKNLKVGAFVNATKYKTDIFKKSIESLARLEYRGNLNESGFRNIIRNLNEWYNLENNPLFDSDTFNDDIKFMLDTIAQGKGDITVEEMEMGEKVVGYFKHFVENWNKVRRGGKLVDAMPIAEKDIANYQSNARNQNNWFVKKTDSYKDDFLDPISIARMMDGYYTNGFFTQTIEDLRQGEIGAATMRRNLLKPFADFFEEHKNFQKTIQNKTVQYGDTQIPASIAMQLYMTLHRNHALKGLLVHGFKYKDGRIDLTVGGLIPSAQADDATITVRATEAIKSLASQFSADEMAFIRIAEKAYEECKEIKRETDMLRMGYTNIEDGYYVPIRRANAKAEKLDDTMWLAEANSAGNPSFNKDTVKGAQQALLLEPINIVVDRHIESMSMYANLATAIDNYQTLVNLDISGNPNNPVTIKTESKAVWSEGLAYMRKLIQDVQGMPSAKPDGGLNWYSPLRQGFAVSQLAANPKVWFTQLTSIPAALSKLRIGSIFRGFGINANDVDKYCELAAIRNEDNTAALAQGVLDKQSKGEGAMAGIRKVGDLLMKPIGMMDRFVIKRLFGACQVEVATSKGLQLGTDANKVAAGELLTQVIFETQQNSFATERSGAMRSSSEMKRTLTMFSADAMKVFGRIHDAVGELVFLKRKLKTATGDEVARIQARIKTVKAKAARAIGASAASAVFMALIAQAFRWLRAQNEEDENIVKNMSLDALGNMIGGLPLFRDIYSFFLDGYELEGFNYSSINDMLNSFKNLFTALGDIGSGKEDKLPLAIKNLFVSLGSMLGLPVRNVFNYVTGLIKRISPSAGYKIDDFFYNKSYRSDLEKAVKKGDDKMIATIASLMLDSNVGGVEDSNTRKAMNDLVSKGYDVIPSGTPDKFTYEDTEYTLTNRQKKRFAQVYEAGNEVVADMVAMKTFADADDEVKARAIRFVYQTYRNLAVQDMLGVDLETKSVLFAEAIPIEKLALIVAMADAIEADKDKNGKSIGGTRKPKIQSMVSKLRMTAAEKYMVMGYLGYTNVNGEAQVKAYINRLKMTDSEKAKLLEYSGYKVA